MRGTPPNVVSRFGHVGWTRLYLSFGDSSCRYCYRCFGCCCWCCLIANQRRFCHSVGNKRNERTVALIALTAVSPADITTMWLKKKKKQHRATSSSRTPLRLLRQLLCFKSKSLMAQIQPLVARNRRSVASLYANCRSRHSRQRVVFLVIWRHNLTAYHTLVCLEWQLVNVLSY